MRGETVTATCSRVRVAGGQRYIEALYASLHPDNMEPARGMRISESLVKGVYEVEVCVENGLRDSLKTVRSTVDEILGLITMLEAVVDALGA